MSLTRLLAALPEPLFSTFSIDCVLGVGAYAVVYKIICKNSKEAFALKVIEKEPMRIRLMLPQLTREAQLLQSHADTPHIVQLLETTMTDTHVFLRFQLCHENLEDASEEQGPMSEREALAWLRQACIGVQGLHAAGVIHRDLKPSNLLVDSDGMLRICDFGWACTEAEGLSGQCGTPEYSPPETLKIVGPAHTRKADIYGLGASFQHLLLGRVPKGPEDRPKGLSVDTRKLLSKMLDPDPALRPSAKKLLNHPLLREDIVTQVWNYWNSFIPAALQFRPPDMSLISLPRHACS